MKVIICGCGDVGSSIASYLFNEGHQVSIIDGDAEKLKKMENLMDIKSTTMQMKADSYKMAALSLEVRNQILKNVKENCYNKIIYKRCN